MNRAAVLALLAVCPLVFAQNSGQSKPPVAAKSTRSAAQNLLFAKPLDWNEQSVRMFDDVPLEMLFSLTTSWIPGPDHKGMFRYKVIASPNPKVVWAGAKPEKITAFIYRVRDSGVTIALYDSDGFLLRKVPLVFSVGQDNDAHVNGLVANDAVQMDAEEYRKLVWDSSGSGSYSIHWGMD